MTTERDIRNQIEFARFKGIAEGKAEGKAEGISEIVARLKALGVDTATICKASGLSPEQVETL